MEPPDIIKGAGGGWHWGVDAAGAGTGREVAFGSSAPETSPRVMKEFGEDGPHIRKHMILLPPGGELPF